SVAEKGLRCREQPAVVFVPAHSLARAERGEDFVFAVPQRSRYVESGRKKRGTVWVRQYKSVFRWQEVLAVVSVEQHISPGDLPVKPLSHRAFISVGAACQFIRIDGTTLCHGAVKAELVPKVGHDTSHGGCEIGYHLTGELLDFLLHVFTG